MHRLLDQETAELDEPFEVEGYEIMYPGDPDADPEMVYHCRCKLTSALVKYPRRNAMRRDNTTGEVIPMQTYEEWYEGKKQLESKLSSIEMSRKSGYTHQKTTPEGTKIIPQAIYNKLTNPIERVGGLVMRGTPEVEEHLQKQGATALQLGDVIMFRSDATISDVLEETHHFWQNRRGMNDDKDINVRTALNEIDAKEYLISVAEKYKIPVEETELTKQQLEYYKHWLEELEGKS